MEIEDNNQKLDGHKSVFYREVSQNMLSILKKVSLILTVLFFLQLPIGFFLLAFCDDPSSARYCLIIYNLTFILPIIQIPCLIFALKRFKNGLYNVGTLALFLPSLLLMIPISPLLYLLWSIVDMARLLNEVSIYGIVTVLILLAILLIVRYLRMKKDGIGNNGVVDRVTNSSDNKIQQVEKRARWSYAHYSALIGILVLLVFYIIPPILPHLKLLFFGPTAPWFNLFLYFYSLLIILSGIIIYPLSVVGITLGLSGLRESRKIAVFGIILSMIILILNIIGLSPLKILS